MRWLLGLSACLSRGSAKSRSQAELPAARTGRELAALRCPVPPSARRAFPRTEKRASPVHPKMGSGAGSPEAAVSSN